MSSSGRLPPGSGSGEGCAPQVLLADDLEPVPDRGGRAEQLSRERQRLVEHDVPFGREHELDALPGLALLGRLGAGLAHRLLELPNGGSTRSLHPGALHVAASDHQHGLGLSDGDLAAPHGAREQGPLSQLAGEPDEPLRRGAANAEPLARVVADGREAEPENAVALRERGEGLAQGHVERPMPPRHAREERVDEDAGLAAAHVPALVRARRPQRPCALRDGGERRRIGQRANLGWRVCLEHA